MRKNVDKLNFEFALFMGLDVLLKRRKEGIGISDAFVYENVYNSKVYILLSLWFELLNMIHNLINRKTCQEVSKGASQVGL